MTTFRQPTEDELVEYHQQQMEEARERRLAARWHSYDPTCGCASCEPEEQDDED